MRLLATLAGLAAVLALLVLLPAVAARRGGRGRGWLLLGVYALALALAGYALLAAGMCGASEVDVCEPGHGLRLAIAPGAIAASSLAALLVLARRRP